MLWRADGNSVTIYLGETNMVYEFSASGKILLEVTPTVGDDADFGMSGTIQVPSTLFDYNTSFQETQRLWINGQQVREAVVSGFPPAPGQNTTLVTPFAYLQVISANFWLTNGESEGFSMPLPHSWPSGLTAPTSEMTGTWSVIYVGPVGFQVYASPDAYDFSGDSNYVIHGIIRFVNF
jgi:hypothetical protein